MKRHHPAAFLAGLLNAYPMGFYLPATLVKDAQRHGVEVHPIDVAHSSWKTTLERDRRDGNARNAKKAEDLLKEQDEMPAPEMPAPDMPPPEPKTDDPR